MAHRLSTTVIGSFAIIAMAVPAFAHHGDDGSQYNGVMPQQEGDFADTAANANERSNAPRSFAPCRKGMAAGTFPCDGVDMLSRVPHAKLGTTFVNDIWGWTDRETKKDYALVGASEGTVFVDISDPKRPNVQGILPTASTKGGAFWRDIKVYADHAYVVSEHTRHGMQVFDLTELRDWDGTYTTYRETSRYTGFGSAHNVAINTDTGYAYAVGARQDSRYCNYGLHMVDIDNPANPRFAGCARDNGYIHDTQCVTYQGPDRRYLGREICFSSNALGWGPRAGQFVAIIDVTNKRDPVTLARMRYKGAGYSHQGWLTPDQRYFLHGDEGDELIHGVGTTTRVWDVTDLDNPRVTQVFENDTSSIDHNLYTQGRYAYASNYTSGLRVYDIREVATGGLREVAFFDVYPRNDNPTFEGGTWSNYPYFRQKGVVAVSSMDRGLFVLQPRVGRAGN